MIGGGEPRTADLDARARRLDDELGLDASASIELDGHTSNLVAPATEDELSAILALASKDRWACVVRGAGLRLGWTHPADRIELVISTERLTGVVAFEPGDGTVTALAGTRMSELRARVAEGGYHLTPDVPHPAHSTLGGVLAADVSGVDRLRSGPTRHNVLGMRVLSADGRAGKSGGRLVKNVTGYDLHRLHAGAHGTLGVIVESTLRLSPEPEAHGVVRARFGSPSAALTAAEALLDGAVRATSLEIELAFAGNGSDGGSGDSQGCTATLALAGRKDVLAWELDRVHAAWSAANMLDVLHDADGTPLYLAMRDRGDPDARAPRLVLGVRPSQLERALDTLGNAVRETLPLPFPSAYVHPGLGSVELPISPDVEAKRLLELDARITAARLSRRWLDAPDELRRTLDVFGATSPALALMRRLKEALDPDGVFATGRHHGRI